jgi:hypothetical protein
MDSISGQMEVSLKETSKMGSDTVMVFGKEEQDNQINMKEFMLMIKNAGMEYSLGQVEIFTKETILMM